MIHNGIEYGMMQAMAEGFDILRNRGSAKLPGRRSGSIFDLADVAEVWRRGSVVTSWLLDLTAEALARTGSWRVLGHVADGGGEGRWTIEAAIEEAVPADVLAVALFTRFPLAAGPYVRGEGVVGDAAGVRRAYGGAEEVTVLVVMGVAGWRQDHGRPDHRGAAWAGRSRRGMRCIRRRTCAKMAGDAADG
jgi:6-phosphogluconate dehydrogenase (decarboxylating)